MLLAQIFWSLFSLFRIISASLFIFFIPGYLLLRLVNYKPNNTLELYLLPFLSSIGISFGAVLFCDQVIKNITPGNVIFVVSMLILSIALVKLVMGKEK